MKCFDRLTTHQRLLLGIALSFVGGFLPWFLLREYDLRQDLYRWTHLEEILYPSLLLSLGFILVLSGVGAYCIARTRALLVVPLAVLIGYLIGVKLFYFYPNMVFRYHLIESLSPVLVEAFMGAALGLVCIPVAARWGESMRPQAWWARLQQQVQAEAALHAAPPSAPAAKTQARQEPIPASHPAVPAQVPTEQDDIARVLAEMQQEYAKTNPQEPSDGTHQTL